MCVCYYFDGGSNIFTLETSEMDIKFTSPLFAYIIQGCHYYYRLSHFCEN